MSKSAQANGDRRTLYERHDIRRVARGVSELDGTEGLSDGKRHDFRVVTGDRRGVLGDLRVERVRAAQGVLVVLRESRDLREPSGKRGG